MLKAFLGCSRTFFVLDKQGKENFKKAEKMEPIHIKIDFEEAVNSKRDLLMCEMSLLKIVNMIKRYQELREAEIIRKSELRNKLKEVRLRLEHIRKNTPKLKSVKKEKKEIEEKVSDIEKKSSIELELKDIKEKLEKLNF